VRAPAVPPPDATPLSSSARASVFPQHPKDLRLACQKDPNFLQVRIF